MTTAAIILSHYKQREQNLKRIVNDLFSGSVTPSVVCIFIDNPDIEFNDPRVNIIRSNESLMPIIRFAIGSYFTTNYCLFLDDDLSVRENTLKNLVDWAKKINDPKAILGLQGSILGHTDNPYADDTSIKRGPKEEPVEVDVILRTYFVPRLSMSYATILQSLHPHLTRKSLDDVYLSLGNKYLIGGKNYVVGVEGDTDLDELTEGGVGQSFSGEHYENRNRICKYLMEEYGK